MSVTYNREIINTYLILSTTRLPNDIIKEITYTILILQCNVLKCNYSSKFSFVKKGNPIENKDIIDFLDFDFVNYIFPEFKSCGRMKIYRLYFTGTTGIVVVGGDGHCKTNLINDNTKSMIYESRLNSIMIIDEDMLLTDTLNLEIHLKHIRQYCKRIIFILVGTRKILDNEKFNFGPKLLLEVF